MPKDPTSRATREPSRAMVIPMTPEEVSSRQRWRVAGNEVRQRSGDGWALWIRDDETSSAKKWASQIVQEVFAGRVPDSKGFYDFVDLTGIAFTMHEESSHGVIRFETDVGNAIAQGFQIGLQAIAPVDIQVLVEPRPKRSLVVGVCERVDHDGFAYVRNQPIGLMMYKVAPGVGVACGTLLELAEDGTVRPVSVALPAPPAVAPPPVGSRWWLRGATFGDDALEVIGFDSGFVRTKWAGLTGVRAPQNPALSYSPAQFFTAVTKRAPQPEPRPGQTWRFVNSERLPVGDKTELAFAAGQQFDVVDASIGYGFDCRSEGLRFMLPQRAWKDSELDYVSGPTERESARDVVRRVVRVESENPPEGVSVERFFAYLVNGAENVEIDEWRQFGESHSAELRLARVTDSVRFNANFARRCKDFEVPHLPRRGGRRS